MKKTNLVNILITRGIIVMPNTTIKIEVGRKISTNSIDDAIKNGGNLIVVSQKNPSVDAPKKTDLFKVGTLASVSIKNIQEDGSYTVVVKGTKRVLLTKINENSKTFFTAEYTEVEDSNELTKENEPKVDDIL